MFRIAPWLMLFISLAMSLVQSVWGSAYAAESSQQSVTPDFSWRDDNLSAAEIAWLQQHPQLKLGIDRTFAPYEWVDNNGHYTGISADYFALLEQRLGVSFVPVTDKHSWSEVLNAARNGEFDLMSCMVKTAEREVYLDFSQPYLSSTAVIISEQSKGYIGTLDKLKGKRVAIHKGHFTNELLRRDYPEITIINPATIQGALRMVAEGEAVAFVGDATAAGFVMKQEGILNLSFSGHTDYQSDFRIGVYRGNPILSGIIEKALNSITESERNQIFEHWAGLTVSQNGIAVEKILKVSGLVLLVLLFILYWNFRLYRSEEAHRKSEKRFKNLVDTTNGIVWEADYDTYTYTYISDNVTRVLGYPIDTWFKPNFWKDHIHPDDRAWAIRFCDEAVADQRDHELEYRFLTASGATVWLRDMVNVVAEDGKPRWLRGLMLDITDQKMADMLIRQSESRFRELIESLPAIAVQGYDENRRVIYWNDASETLYGYTREEALGQPLESLIIPQAMRETVIQLHHDWLEKGQEIPASELELQHKDGSLVPVFSSHVMLRSENDRQEMYCIDVNLIEQKRARAELTRMAHYDSLTHLPNRRTFTDRLLQMMKKADRDGEQVAVMMIDLDRFKEVNDTLGHDYGDLLLQGAAKRLLSCVRETDTVARLGGDEFLVILGNIDDLSVIERVAGNILRQLGEPFILKDSRSFVSASIGIALYPSDAMTLEALMKNADQAMYAAKEEGRNRFHYFTPEMEAAAQRRRRLLNELREAIDRQQFAVYYQPVIDLQNGRVVKAEALLRWNHPRGQVSPLDFIPLAEETGLIVDIGNWVFAEVVRQLTIWQARFNTELQVSVNTSPVQYQDDNCSKPNWFGHILTHNGAANLCVEITESLLMEAGSGVADKLLQFRDQGIEVALDDFGTGYSSLSYLKQFHIDYLKIDQSFVSHLTPGSQDLVLCEAIIVMAHTLGIKVIAEGVETPEQKQMLLDIGCDFGQGYLFGRPVPASEFSARWLESQVINEVE
ncbi:EAL domain-containing protein [Amphritea pacifica]|uniref:EAL domain-containing protein n=1 Tax=Amphritea pacifica TaxID=2811233 RepID=A0ABS2WBE3_9GAMM|nr:EAL domain-containing protein [Amphritea pacifica]MBN0988888.1 EAL domain-containing protein [Amphritea pacifica]